MAKTATPIFTQTPKLGFVKLTGTDVTADGTGANVKLLFTAGATDGSYLTNLICMPISTSGSTSTSTTVIRIYLNNGSTPATSTNNQLIREVSIGYMTVSQTSTAGAKYVPIPISMQIPAGYAVYVSCTALAANTQWNITSVHGDY